MGFQYSIDRLMSLRRVKPLVSGVFPDFGGEDNTLTQYYLIWDEINDMIRDGGSLTMPTSSAQTLYRRTRRYDPSISNNAFKRRWYASNKTVDELSRIVKTECFILNERSLTARFDKKLRKLLCALDNARAKITWLSPEGRRENLAAQIETAKALEKSQGPVRRYKIPKEKAQAIKARGKVRPDPKGPRMAKGVAKLLLNGAYGDYITFPGGRTFTVRRPPPKGKWPKYWYFYRTRGSWTVSEHHPYGSEYEELFRAIPYEMEPGGYTLSKRAGYDPASHRR